MVGIKHSNRTKTRSICLAWLGLAGCLVAVGCGSEYRQVHGTVTVDGKPLTKGTVHFIPSGGRNLTAKIAQDGSYWINTSTDQRGILPGDYKVTVVAVDVSSSKSAPKSFAEEMQGVGSGPAKMTRKSLVPDRYSEASTTPLVAAVEAGGATKFDFDLTE